MLESIFTTMSTETLTLSGLLTSLAIAFVLGLIVSGVYISTHKTKMPSQSFALTLVILPTVITIIILLVGNNIARAFSLAGAFSIIRFRSAPGDPKEITFVLICMALGLSVGMGFLAYAVVVALLLCLAIIILEALHFGKPKASMKIVKIVIPENVDYMTAFDSVMKKYTLSFTLNKVKTIDLGSLYELQYCVVIQEGQKEKEFLDELRCRNGNLNITLIREAIQAEF